MKKQRKYHIKKLEVPNYERLYSIWSGMMNRCYRKEQSNYKYYGGRGIAVDKRWFDFKAFYDDMFTEYKNHCNIFGEVQTTLDRVDNNGDYSKENCCWKDRKSQCANTRRNKHITFNGETKNIAEWSRLLGIEYSALYKRVFYRKMPLELAFK